MPGPEKINEQDSRYELGKATEEFKKTAESENSPAFGEMLASLDRLNDYQTSFYKRDRKGLLPGYGETEHAEMRRLYAEAIRTTDAYLAEKSEAERGAGTAAFAADGIRRLLLRDNAHFAGFRPAADVTFPAALNAARSLTVNTTGKEISSWGGAQSQRLPMSITDRSGKIVNGVFTPVRKAGVTERYKKTIETVTTQYPATKELFGTLLEKTREFGNSGQSMTIGGHAVSFNPKGNEYDIFLLFQLSTRNRRITTNGLTTLIAAVNGKSETAVRRTPGYEDAALTFCKLATEYNVGEGINLLDLQLHEGDRVDDRNAAMSTVAGLLGRSDLICRACPMTVVHDGKETEGTFMEMANGVDPAHPTEEALNYHPGGDHCPEAMKAIADLQVIDYICGNVDRHGFNYFYQFENKNGSLHLTGIQGIDNDSSFGENKDAFTSNYNRLVGTDNMCVVSGSMAEKLDGLTEEMLRFSLRGYSLSEKSIDSACARLTHLKDCIEKGRQEYAKERESKKAARDAGYIKENFIRVLPDEKFDEATLSAFRSSKRRDVKTEPKKRMNLFDSVSIYGIDPYSVSNSKKTPAYARSDSPVSTDALRSKNAAVLGLLEKIGRATNYRGSSPQFDKMKKSLEDLARVYRNCSEGFVDFDSVLAMNKATNRLIEDSGAYVAKKNGEKKLSDYAAGRKRLGEEILAFAEGAIIDLDKLSEADKADLRHNEEMNIQQINRNAVRLENELPGLIH